MTRRNPALNGEPVVVIHLDTAPGAGLTACSGDEFDPPAPDDYPNLPRLLCPLCQHYATRREQATPPATFVEAFDAAVNARRDWLNLPDYDTNHQARHQAADLATTTARALHRALDAWVEEAAR